MKNISKKILLCSLVVAFISFNLYTFNNVSCQELTEITTRVFDRGDEDA